MYLIRTFVSCHRHDEIQLLDRPRMGQKIKEDGPRLRGEDSVQYDQTDRTRIY